MVIAYIAKISYFEYFKTVIFLHPDDIGKNAGVSHGQRQEIHKMIDIMELEELDKVVLFVFLKKNWKIEKTFETYNFMYFFVPSTDPASVSTKC